METGSHNTLLHELHWLPVTQRIQYNILQLFSNVYIAWAPLYLNELLYHPSRSLRSQNQGLTLILPRQKPKSGDQIFSKVGPPLWMTLPRNIRNYQYFPLFKRLLKIDPLQLAMTSRNNIIYCNQCTYCPFYIAIIFYFRFLYTAL